MMIILASPDDRPPLRPPPGWRDVGGVACPEGVALPDYLRAWEARIQCLPDCLPSHDPDGDTGHDPADGPRSSRR